MSQRYISIESMEMLTDTLRKVTHDEAEAYRSLEIVYDQVRTLDALKPKALDRAGQTGKLVRELLDKMRDYMYAHEKKRQVENI